MDLSYKQTKCLDVLENVRDTEILYGGGAGSGKSILGCYWVIKSCLRYPNTRWVIGRNSLKTLKETTLNSFYWVCNEQGVKQGIHFVYNDNKSSIKFKNGSEILLKDLGYYPSDPDFDELGSLEITGAFVDECNQIVHKGWQVLKSRIRYNLDKYGLIPKILGTCNPSKGWVFQEFYLPQTKDTMPKGRVFIQSLLDDNPFISKHYKENLLTLDKASIERLLYGNWNYDDDPSDLCEFDAILDAFTNDHVKPTGTMYISADLAMQGRDKFVMGVWDGNICDITLVRDKSTGLQIQQDLQSAMIKYSVGRSNTVADSDGMGSYLVSYLRGIKEFHGNGRAVDAEFANIKSECAYKLAELINKRNIKIICNNEQKEKIIQELGVLKADSVDNDTSKKKIIPKDRMKELLGRSPDYLDMLIMKMVFNLEKSRSKVFLIR